MPPTFFRFPFELSREEAIDFVLVTASLNFAYTDFTTRERSGPPRRRWSRMPTRTGCTSRFIARSREGVPVLDGPWLSQVTVDELRDVLRGGTTELQMLDERAEILRDIGARLVDRYDGRFHNFATSTSSRLYDGGRGFFESLVREFPRFDDSVGDVHFWKLAQLAVWILEISLQDGRWARLR